MSENSIVLKTWAYGAESAGRYANEDSFFTSDPRAAKWISETIGEVEMERIKETVNTGQFLRSGRSKSYSAERRVEPLVLPSEISGLPRLRALLKVDNLVVPFGFPYLAPQKRQPGFIPRQTTGIGSWRCKGEPRD